MYSKTFLSKDYKIRCPKILKVNFVISTNQQNYDKITNAFSYQNGALTFLLSFIDKNCYFAFEAFIYFLFFFVLVLSSWCFLINKILMNFSNVEFH